MANATLGTKPTNSFQDWHRVASKYHSLVIVQENKQQTATKTNENQADQLHRGQCHDCRSMQHELWWKNNGGVHVISLPQAGYCTYRSLLRSEDCYQIPPPSMVHPGGMPFGIKSAQDVFQKRINQPFGDLAGNRQRWYFSLGINWRGTLAGWRTYTLFLCALMSRWLE